MADDETKPGDSPQASSQETDAAPAKPTVETIDPPSGAGETIVETDEEQLGLMRELLDESPVAEGDKADTGDGEPKPEDQEPDKPTPTPDVAEPVPDDPASPPGGDEPEAKTFEFEFEGKKLSAEVTPDLFEALTAMTVMAGKYPNQTRVLNEAYEQLANAGLAGAPAEGALPEGPPTSVRQESVADIAQLTEPQYIEKFSPLVDALKSQNYFGEDGELAEAYPRLATTLALIEFVGVPALARLEEVAGASDRRAAESEMDVFFTKLNTTLDAVAERGDGFEPLKEPKNRERFYGHLRELNIDQDKVFEEDFLAGQWRAFNNNMFTELERKASEVARKKKEGALDRARGGGGGSGTVVTPPADGSSGDEQVDMMRALLK